MLVSSMSRRSTAPFQVTALDVEQGTWGGEWQTEQWATPWTALRWAVPALCGYAGRAVYFDCPSLVVGDIGELASAAIPQGAFVLLARAGARLSTSCAVFDCAAARAYLPPLPDMRQSAGVHHDIGALLERRPRLVGALPPGWGTSDALYGMLSPPERAGVKSIHFASPYTQPHMPLARQRLGRARQQHWFTAPLLPHYSAALCQMFSEEYAALTSCAGGPADAAKII